MVAFSKLCPDHFKIAAARAGFDAVPAGSEMDTARAPSALPARCKQLTPYTPSRRPSRGPSAVQGETGTLCWDLGVMTADDVKATVNRAHDQRVCLLNAAVCRWKLSPKSAIWPISRGGRRGRWSGGNGNSATTKAPAQMAAQWASVGALWREARCR
jgi:hypothetical protein